MNMRHSAKLRVGVLTPLLGERFTVVREVGGGMASTVLLAMDRTLGREVAVKVFEPSDSPDARDRFEREIVLTSRLRHPLIVPMLDHGIVGEHRYYVMPYVPDETLRARLEREGRLETAEVVRVALDLCEALMFAHAAGVVHRDVKPENVFSNATRTQLADFGIATAVGSSEGMRLTASGVVHGTVTYMSPEQGIGRHDLDGRSDLYALGCVLFELLTGAPPYRHVNLMQLVGMHVSAPIPDLQAAAPLTPRTLVALVRALLAKSRNERPSTAAAVHDTLLVVRSGVEGSLSMPVASATPRGLDVISPSMMATRQGRSLLARGLDGGTGALDSLRVARTYFERALALDGENQSARLGLAEAIQALGLSGGDNPERAKRESTQLRLSAVQQGGSSSEVLVVLAETLMYWEDDLGAAGRNIARALVLEPEHAGALRLHGVWLKIMGRGEEAVHHLRAAVRVHPHDVEMRLALADALVALGRDLEAMRELDTARRPDPRHEGTLSRTARCAHRAGLVKEAIDARRALLQQRGLNARVTALDADVKANGWTAARKAELQRDLDALMRRAASEDPFLPRGAHHQLADELLITLAALDLYTEAMDCIAEGARRRPGRLRVVLTDLPLDRRALASDARYAPLLKSAGLEELI